MHEELENFERNRFWEFVDPPPGCKPIGTKWVWKNKEGEKGEVVRNKSRLIAQGFSQKEGCWGVTRKIRITALTREREQNTFKH
jgi:hypothetical protein